MNNPQVNDLVKHKDDGSLYLSRIDRIDGDGFCYITDEYILVNNKNHILSDSGIGSRSIITNYGNITLDEFFEMYPEYAL